MIGDVIKSKAGLPQLDMRGKPLHVGQHVLIMDNVYSKGCRGSVSTGIIVGFNRYVTCLSDQANQHEIETWSQFFDDKASGKLKGHKDYEVMRERGLSTSVTDSVSSEYLIGCTPEFMRGWNDGSIFR